MAKVVGGKGGGLSDVVTASRSLKAVGIRPVYQRWYTPAALAPNAEAGAAPNAGAAAGAPNAGAPGAAPKVPDAAPNDRTGAPAPNEEEEAAPIAAFIAFCRSSEASTALASYK